MVRQFDEFQLAVVAKQANEAMDRMIKTLDETHRDVLQAYRGHSLKRS